MHLSQKLKKVQLLRHATRDIHKWSTVSTLGARAVYVKCTCIVLLVHEDVANMKNIVNRVSLSQLVACVASRMSRRRKLYCESAFRVKADSQYNFLRRDTRFATVATRNCLSRAVASCRNAPVAEVEESSTFATCDTRYTQMEYGFDPGCTCSARA